MTQETTPDIMIVLKQLPSAELEVLYKKIIGLIKQRRAIEQREKMMDFSVGVNVVMTGDSKKIPVGTLGVIEKINRTRCSVDFGMKGIWNVPATMMELAK